MKTLLAISTYAGAHRLSWLLKSVHLRPPWPDAISVVDDGSPLPSHTREVADEWKAKGLPITYIEHGHNRGISAGWNTASRAVDADVVILSNDDVILSSGWMAPLVYVLEHSPGVGVVGQSWHAFTGDDVGKLLESEFSDREVVPREPLKKEQDASRREKYEDTNPGRVMCPTGQLFAFRRKDFDAIGGFDENYKSFFEESCFGTSMAARGLIGVQTSWPYCWHMWSATFAASPELQPSVRMENSRDHYRRKWGIPDSVPRGQEFSFTNPKFMEAIGDVPVKFLRKAGPASGILRRDCAFVEGDA